MDYFQPDFDPSKLTLVELIRFLTSHDIPVPTSRAKKEVYVQLFKQHIAELRKKQVPIEGEVIVPRRSPRKKPSTPKVTPKTPAKATPKTPAKTLRKVEESTPKRFMNLDLEQIANSPYVKPQVVEPIETKKNSFKFPLWILLLVLLGLFFDGVFLISYCDGTDNPHPHKWNPMTLVLPSCYPCPQHASCSDQTMTCQEDYKAKLFWHISYCKKDISAKEKQVKLLQVATDALDDIVRSWTGKVVCGTIHIPEEYKWYTEKNKGIPLNLAKQRLMKRLRWSETKFAPIWEALLDKVITTDFMLFTEFDETKSYRLILSRNHPHLSFTCKLKLTIYQTFVDYAHWIFTTLLTGAISVFYYYSLDRKRKETRIVNTIVQDVLDSVHQETENYHQDPVRHPVPGLPMAQLFDHFLPSIFPPNAPTGDFPCLKDSMGRHIFYLDELTRNRIWPLVSKEILKNSFIRETVMEVKGESHIVWMWIGSFALSPRKK